MPNFEEITGAPASTVLGDQLTRDERIRLEALNQAVILNTTVAISDEQVVSIAKRFEHWIRFGNDNGGDS